jgi:hypothetical protein
MLQYLIRRQRVNTELTLTNLIPPCQPHHGLSNGHRGRVIGDAYRTNYHRKQPCASEIIG